MPSGLMKRLLPCLLICVLAPSAAQAVDEDQQAAINGLGSLNGLALKCKFYDETNRMKAAMVETVPKLRALGALFEDATNAGFVKALQDPAPCPSATQFAELVAEGIDRLRKAFAN